MVEFFGFEIVKCRLIASLCYFIKKLRLAIRRVKQMTYDRNYSLIGRYHEVTVRSVVLLKFAIF